MIVPSGSMELDALKVTATPRSTGVGVTVNRAIGGCGPGGADCTTTVWLVRFVKLSLSVTVKKALYLPTLPYAWVGGLPVSVGGGSPESHEEAVLLPVGS